MGVFEMDAFAKGTFAIADTLANLNGITIIGGGDSVAAVEKAGLADKMSTSPPVVVRPGALGRQGALKRRRVGRQVK